MVCWFGLARQGGVSSGRSEAVKVLAPAAPAPGGWVGCRVLQGMYPRGGGQTLRCGLSWPQRVRGGGAALCGDTLHPQLRVRGGHPTLLPGLRGHGERAAGAPLQVSLGPCRLVFCRFAPDSKHASNPHSFPSHAPHPCRLVSHALCACMRALLADWARVVAQLEHQLRLGQLSLQALVFYCQVGSSPGEAGTGRGRPGGCSGAPQPGAPWLLQGQAGIRAARSCERAALWGAGPRASGPEPLAGV